MPYLHSPSEPSRETIKKYGQSYNDGLADFWGSESIDEAIVAKQGMIEYLFEQWEHQNISRNEIAEACGAANTPIEQWYNDKTEWDVVMKRVESAIDGTIS